MRLLCPRPNTPAAAGYRWPAEWEPQAATWIAWPHKRDTWPGKFDAIPPRFAAWVRTLALFEHVRILAGGDSVRADAAHWLGDCPNVTLHDIPTNDAWCRDHGPIFLAGPPGSRPALVDWEFNAWGGKYAPCDLDNDVPRRIAETLGRLRFQPGIVLEGGGIDGNGRGTVLTTEACLLNQNRNPSLDRAAIEQYLADYLGARHVVWLSGPPLAGDDTDGHVDQVARFVQENTVVAALEENPSDENYAPLQANLAQLRQATDHDGRPLNVIPLPMPRPLHYDGQRLPASYCNFHLANGVAIVPQFDDPNDSVALALLRPLLPGRQVIGLPALDIVWGLGAFHCLSQQEPA